MIKFSTFSRLRTQKIKTGIMDTIQNYIDLALRYHTSKKGRLSYNIIQDHKLSFPCLLTLNHSNHIYLFNSVICWGLSMPRLFEQILCQCIFDCVTYCNTATACKPWPYMSIACLYVQFSTIALSCLVPFQL
jgi:hypothetical protein